MLVHASCKLVMHCSVMRAPAAVPPGAQHTSIGDMQPYSTEDPVFGVQMTRCVLSRQVNSTQQRLYAVWTSSRPPAAPAIPPAAERHIYGNWESYPREERRGGLSTR